MFKNNFDDGIEKIIFGADETKEDSNLEIEPEVEPEPEPELELEPEQKQDSNEVIGVVTECTKLNVRERPSKNSEIIATAKLADDVLVNLEKSTEDFYSVVTSYGIEGFCMKQYIAI